MTVFKSQGVSTSTDNSPNKVGRFSDSQKGLCRKKS